MGLIQAARDGNLEEVQRLINQGPGEAGIHFQDDRPLILRSFQWSSFSCRILVSRGADIHARDDQLLFMQLGHGRFSTCRILG